MKKLFLLFALIAAFTICTPVEAQTKIVKIENVKQDTNNVLPVVINGVIEAIKDSAFRAEATIAVENMKTEWYARPVAGSSFWAWFQWIILFLVIPFSIISTFIARFIPTTYKNKYKAFRVLEWVADFLYWIAKLIPNRNIIKGKHE